MVADRRLGTMKGVRKRPAREQCRSVVGHGNTQESACGQTGQGRDSQVRWSSVLERDKTALDVRGQQALSADSSVGQREQQGRRRRRRATGEQCNGGEAGHTQEVLKLEDHWDT